jgi:hypothetical protein
MERYIDTGASGTEETRVVVSHRKPFNPFDMDDDSCYT